MQRTKIYPSRNRFENPIPRGAALSQVSRGTAMMVACKMILAAGLAIATEPATESESPVASLLGTWELKGSQETAAQTIVIKQIDSADETPNSPENRSGGFSASGKSNTYLTLQFTDVGGNLQRGRLSVSSPSKSPSRFAVHILEGGRVKREWFGKYMLKNGALNLSFTGVNLRGTKDPQPMQWSKILEQKFSPQAPTATWQRQNTQVGN